MKKEIIITALDVQHQRIPPREGSDDNRPLWAVRLSRYNQYGRTYTDVRIVRADNAELAMSAAQQEEDETCYDEEGNYLKPYDTWLGAEAACKVEDIPPPRMRLFDRNLKKGDTPPDAGRVVGHTGNLSYPPAPVEEDGVYLYWQVEEIPSDSAQVVRARDLQKEDSAA